MKLKFITVVLTGVFIAGIIPFVNAEMTQRLEKPLERQETVHQSRPSDHFTDAQIEKGKRYRFTRYWLFLLHLGWTVGVLIFFLGVGGHDIIEGIALWISGERRWLTVAIASVILVIQLWILLFPFTVYEGYIHEKTYGLLTQDFGGWFLDYLKGRAIDLAVIVPVSMSLFLLIRRFSSLWWIIAGGGSSVLLVSFVFLAPVVVDPLFYTFTPIENKAVRSILLKLADRAGLEVANVLEMNASTKMNRLNAYVTGLGKTKRVVVYDTLIHDLTPEEVGVVFAHELGHWRRYHLWQGIALGTVGSFIAFFITYLLLRVATTRGIFGLSASASFGSLIFIFLAITLMDFATLPLQNWISRRFEKEADREALTLTGDPKTFIKVEERLAVRNLADVDPYPFFVWFFFTHPPVMERIGMAEVYNQTLERRTKRQEDRETRGRGDKGMEKTKKKRRKRIEN